MVDETSWFVAVDAALTPLVLGRNMLALVDGTQASGLLAALREGGDSASLAERTGLPERTVGVICEALASNDVVVSTGEHFGLTPSWQALLADNAYTTLELILRSGDVESHLLRSIGAGTDYWTMSTEKRLTFARAISPDPFSAGLVASFRALAEHDPEHAALRSGGRLLELGCGVAGRLLTCLQAFPNLTAVGIELADDLADEAERRAVALGVADRLTVVRSDAGAYLEPDSFDFGYWSQFFFPEQSRRSALTALFANLRSGGIAWAPVLGDFPAMQADPTGQVRREYALFRVILDSWGVPERTPDQLAAEFDSAGFIEVRQGGGGAAGPVRLNARKP